MTVTLSFPNRRPSALLLGKRKIECREGTPCAVINASGAVAVDLLLGQLSADNLLIAYPASMMHAEVGMGACQVAGISDVLLRLQVRLEHEDDLIAGPHREFAA